MTTLTDMAEQIADSVESHATNVDYQLKELDAEQAKLDKRKADLTAASNAARDARKRLADYNGSSCPYCWISEGQTGDLRSIGGGTDSADMFRCSRCNQVIQVDF